MSNNCMDGDILNLLKTLNEAQQAMTDLEFRIQNGFYEPEESVKGLPVLSLKADIARLREVEVHLHGLMYGKYKENLILDGLNSKEEDSLNSAWRM